MNDLENICHLSRLEQLPPGSKAKPSQNDLNSSRCRSYLLRLWRADEPGDFRWRALLEIPETGERIGFPGLEELFSYLMDLTTTAEL